ncbi:hypothetical protein ESCO_005203 [Escovopsis weberi]|uniref:Uncharacterized protein n=1 Tax=Escovopsis weberi TaxID=150374 RepID=A0A0M8MYP3_ESCWE|nr:hypothetical protein ESCO_005203 [Escovopsis weberi]
MADFLASFNFCDSLPSPASERSCASLEEAQSRLRDIFSAKITPTRAEHVATTLELAGSAQLMLEKENEGLDGLGNIDPILGGLAALSAANEQAEGVFRAVTASDALTNQPADNPVLQRSVAKAIINGLGALDGSEWTLKGLSRGTEGWKFVYICKGSVNHWYRQNKSQVKTLVADCTQSEPDPQLTGPSPS